MNAPTFRYFAFLRAINVSGRNVKMDRLRLFCQELGFTNVVTFIASGNLIFESPSQDASLLEKIMEEKFQQELGYPVETFLRSQSELRAVADLQPFGSGIIDKTQALNIAFVANPPEERAVQKLMALENTLDTFQVINREVFWLCQKKQSESTFSNAVLEKTLGQKSTLRGIQTIHKIAARYIPAKS